MNLFIPGRLCLFGEHSDWAAGYRTVNPKIEMGYAIVVGTNQGIYAEVEVENKLIFKTVNHPQVLEVGMSEDLLLQIAKSENFYSYIRHLRNKNFLVKLSSLMNFANLK
jgi:galactokinase